MFIGFIVVLLVVIGSLYYFNFKKKLSADLILANEWCDEAIKVKVASITDNKDYKRAGVSEEQHKKHIAEDEKDLILLRDFKTKVNNVCSQNIETEQKVEIIDTWFRYVAVFRSGGILLYCAPEDMQNECYKGYSTKKECEFKLKRLLASV